MPQEHTQPSPVPSGAKPEGETQAPQSWAWVEASIWTKRMLAALDNGVTGGRWYSLMDKVTAPRTLAAAWKRVAAHKGQPFQHGHLCARSLAVETCLPF
jgi:RNA-directed DNA polymerase